MFVSRSVVVIGSSQDLYMNQRAASEMGGGPGQSGT